VKSRRRMLSRVGGTSPLETINMAVQLTRLEIVEGDFQPNEGRLAPDSCAPRVEKSKALFRQAINSHQVGLLHNGSIWPAPIGYMSSSHSRRFRPVCKWITRKRCNQWWKRKSKTYKHASSWLIPLADRPKWELTLRTLRLG
jgi:hypothetical protein